MPRKRIIHWLARRRGIDVEAVEAGEEGDDNVGIEAHAVQLAGRNGDRRVGTTRTLLHAEGLAKHFGGVRAVDGVNLHLDRGEILGLMGPNGAGKTTLFELLGGFTAPDGGKVTFGGLDVTHVSPEGRARLGLIRSFQDAALFQTLTVIETVSLAFERRHPTNTVFSTMGLHGPDRAKERAARELVALMGLDRFRNKQIRELSTGTRRITELACVVALEPVVLLLDEPSSGIAQRESEALAELLLRLRTHLGCTLVIIEHDIPLLMGLSTRVMAMDTGRVIAVGSPEEVRNNPVVVTSYLGADTAAIERSGPQGLLVGTAEDTTR
jgi:ABC-type branched-subunit amino acid transport system ATPase component